MITEEITETQTARILRLGRVLGHLGIAVSSWYRPSTDEGLRKRPGPPPKPIAEQVVQALVTMATQNPWYGYKRIAVMCRRAAGASSNGPGNWKLGSVTPKAGNLMSPDTKWPLY